MPFYRWMCSCLVSVLAAAGLAALSHAAEPSPPGAVPIGLAKVDITPETPVRMYGYAARKTESEGVAGRLKATAMAIGGDEGEGPAVLLTVDCGAVPGDIRETVFQRVAKTVRIAPERFVLCNSHNHSGPNLKGMGSIEGAERDRLARYAELLTDRLTGVVKEALGNRQPARLELARGAVGFASNRRVLTGGKWSGFGCVADAPVDHELAVLRVSRDGKVVALVANYACHNTTLRGDFKQIHGDWAGCAQQCIESDQPGVLAMITIGCGADADPCPHGTVALCEQHGRALADEVKRLLAGPWTPIRPVLSARGTVLEIPYEKAPDKEIARAAASTSNAVKRLLDTMEKEGRAPVPRAYPIVVWTFGDDLAMVFLSNEVVVDYALRLKRELDASRLWITAYANDVSGYVVSKRLIAEGGYEPRNSLSSQVTFGRPETLEPAMEERIIERVKDMLPKAFHTEREAGETAGAR